VLASGLPPEANVWREEAWPLPVEFQATALERIDLWGRALLAAVLREKDIPVPGPLEILRPGDEPRRRKADGGRVRDFFARHLGIGKG
jgi:hypothetical protein